MTLVLLASCIYAQGQWNRKFEQLDELLPTPNTYRSASGQPGPGYWQQQANYEMKIILDEEKNQIRGTEKITYINNSPDRIDYLWIQLDQNMRAADSNSPLIRSSGMDDTISAASVAGLVDAFGNNYGFSIEKVYDTNGAQLPYVINKTMMRIDIPSALSTGDTYTFHIDWNYFINNRAVEDGRSGYEYFPEDGNNLYAIAQFYPRMAVYDDVNGWQNKQFLGRGEFALTFGNFSVEITVPSDHILGATGTLLNPKEVLTEKQFDRYEQAKTSEDIIIIATQKEAEAREKSRASSTSTWKFYAENVRDFAFATSRKFIWDACMVDLGKNKPLAMSFYPKEGNPLWEEESTKAVKNTLITYSKYSIDYPYPQATSVHSASIGMEYPMICFNYGRPDPDGTYSDRKKYGMIGVIIHEVGHNFFPMIINNDERQWTWMDEGINTFLQYRTEQEQYVNFPSRRGPAQYITRYMGGDKQYIRPIMTNSEQIIQFGSNAYAKPATALNILRETVMGPELFDYAFKQYAQRWAFKHPMPADFFRTMEDASAVDLDWFWRGWFYTTDHVDIAIDKVNWYVMETDEANLEGRNRRVRRGQLSSSEESTENTNDFSDGPKTFVMEDYERSDWSEFRESFNNEPVRNAAAGKNYYEITFKNEGGLVMPIIIEFNYTDGSSEIRRIPAEIWRMNENEVTKVFVTEKEVKTIQLDPFLETADVAVENNVFPKKESNSRFDDFTDGE